MDPVELMGLNYTYNCTPPAIEDFPRDLFTERQRDNGAICIHVLVSLYLFVALAVVCDKFFVPAVEMICAGHMGMCDANLSTGSSALEMSNDVAGATFMAAATSAPELFVNGIGTFITEGDIGVGTIVGSAVFNILAVAACCGIGAGIVVPLDWWPLTRDCVAYGFTVTVMICIIHDERVEWYEALILVLLYTVYIAVMYWDKQIQDCVRRGKNFHGSQSLEQPAEGAGKAAAAGALALEERTSSCSAQVNGSVVSNDAPASPSGVEEEEYELNFLAVPALLQYPCTAVWWRQVAWLGVWPIHVVFKVTIPDCSKPRWKNWFPLTFLMCIVWIGSLSYVVAWMITVIGHSMKIPDSVMGITFLAAGTSVPEAVSSVIVAKHGHGSMGISNSLGSNTFDILLCLGLPWLIKSAFVPTVAGNHFVSINSRGLEYIAITLLSTLMLFYATFTFNKFQLDRRVGHACLIMYALFLILASLIELNVFFMVNLPTCGADE